MNNLNRRAFLDLLSRLGISVTAIPAFGLEQSAPQTANDSSSESQWVLTLGGSDGPHPPFAYSSRRLLTAPELRDAPDEWIDRSLQWINYILHHYRPDVVELPERRPALFRLDEILHIQSAPAKPLVQDFYRMRLESAIAEIEQTRVTEGIRIWRLYNHGALVRTASVSFTFDIVPGTRTPGFALAPEVLKRLVAESDATFISHLHGDHANADVARMFLAAGKPVIAPEGLWADDAQLSKQLTYLKRSIDDVHDVHVREGNQVLKVVAYPGHQGATVVNNVHFVTTPESFSVLHTGDQSGDEGPGTDFEWLTQIGHYRHVDVLLCNGWTNDLHRIVRGVDPQLVIPGHENEMSHQIDHREEYTQDYERMFGLNYPFIVMTWGESYLYARRPSEAGFLLDEN
jgi:L-ascorbate metabolism protein UlaG (beta-lactamase superfamily)